MKFPNQEYKMVYRTGAFIDKDNLRREHESASVVFWCLAGAAMIILAVAIQSCGMVGGMNPRHAKEIVNTEINRPEVELKDKNL